jgi:hypothetical protein
MRYTTPKILNVLNAKKTIQVEKHDSPFTDGVPLQTIAPAYQADE